MSHDYVELHDGNIKRDARQYSGYEGWDENGDRIPSHHRVRILAWGIAGENDDGDVVTYTPYVKSLDLVKREKRIQINKHTDDLILAGFSHNSEVFKITLEKEISALAMQTARMGATDMTGKKFRASGGTYSFVDDADFDAFFATGFGRLETILNEGSELKDSVDAAVDVAAVDAITDTRV